MPAGSEPSTTTRIPRQHIVVEGVGQNLDYNYQQLITISKDMISANCSSNLTNFPVLVSLSGDWLKTVAYGGNIADPDGYDIIFRDANGLAKLDHEIEEYDGVCGHASCLGSYSHPPL